MADWTALGWGSSPATTGEPGSQCERLRASRCGSARSLFDLADLECVARTALGSFVSEAAASTCWAAADTAAQPDSTRTAV